MLALRAFSLSVSEILHGPWVTEARGSDKLAALVGSSYNPTKKVSQPVAPADLENGFVDGPSSTAPAEPNYPKSLYILQPLFATYTLNPVAAEAQASIAAPDGLDIDAWIIPKAKPMPIVIRGEFEGDEKKRKKKSKKGKERDEGGSGKARKNSSK